MGNGEKDLPTAKAVRPTERERRSPLAKSLLVAKATNREARKTIGKSGSSIWVKPKAREGRASGRERVSPDARFLAFELKPAYFNIKNWFVSVQRPVQGTASR